MIFNIYYINSPKVYEIKMMLNNMVSMQQEIESNKQIEGEAYLKTKLGFNIWIFSSWVMWRLVEI
ncbi:hypothetical protein DBR11_13755 [Pedobacter sp. HMWF019]|nr:hypothetical protein DBR11_13755 [Pedobacter sp. HMWF019]